MCAAKLRVGVAAVAVAAAVLLGELLVDDCAAPRRAPRTSAEQFGAKQNGSRTGWEGPDLPQFCHARPLAYGSHAYSSLEH